MTNSYAIFIKELKPSHVVTAFFVLDTGNRSTTTHAYIGGVFRFLTGRNLTTSKYFALLKIDAAKTIKLYQQDGPPRNWAPKQRLAFDQERVR